MVLYTGLHAGGGETPWNFSPLQKVPPPPRKGSPPPPPKNKEYLKTVFIYLPPFLRERERERCAYLQHHHLFWKKPTSILYSTYVYLVVLHNIHNQLLQLVRRVATVLHSSTCTFILRCSQIYKYNLLHYKNVLFLTLVLQPHPWLHLEPFS